MKLLIVDSEEAKKHTTYKCQCIIIIIRRRRSRIEGVSVHTSQRHLTTWRRSRTEQLAGVSDLWSDRSVLLLYSRSCDTLRVALLDQLSGKLVESILPAESYTTYLTTKIDFEGKCAFFFSRKTHIVAHHLSKVTQFDTVTDTHLHKREEHVKQCL